MEGGFGFYGVSLILAYLERFHLGVEAIKSPLNTPMAKSASYPLVEAVRNQLVIRRLHKKISPEDYTRRYLLKITQEDIS